MRTTSAVLLLCACSAATPPGEQVDSGTTPAVGTASGASAGTPVGTPTTGATPTEALDFRERGPFATTTADAPVVASTCTLATTRYTPTGAAEPPLVILAHGFQRNKSHMALLADHWASWGLEVITPNLCHATAFDSDHEANALDLIALAEHARPGAPVLYAGHSAGGLATWLATAADPNAVAHLGLDPVDTGQLGADADGSHLVPTFALLAEGGTCNSNSNATGWYGSGVDDRALRLTGADHCDFEGPTDVLCTALCGGGSADDAATAQIVKSMTTAYVLWQTGVAPQGEAWWTAGEPWFDLVLTAATEL